MNAYASSYSSSAGGDPLRWNLLSVACELCDPKSADFLLRTAMTGIADGCGSQLAVRVLAIDALSTIARRHPEVRGHLVRLIRSRPEPAVLYEAIRAAEELGLHDEVRQALPRLRETAGRIA